MTQTISEAIETEQFSVQKVYVKDITFETPNSPDIFIAEWRPQVNMDISSETKAIDNEMYEVTLTISAKVETGGRIAYRVKAHQAGIFFMEGLDEETVVRMSATTCPAILFPFARELIASMVSRSGFPPLLLAPVSFDALYQKHQQTIKYADTDTKH